MEINKQVILVFIFVFIVYRTVSCVFERLFRPNAILNYTTLYYTTKQQNKIIHNTTRHKKSAAPSARHNFAPITLKQQCYHKSRFQELQKTGLTCWNTKLRYVNLACLPHAVSASNDGDKCWITGWGRLASGGATPTLLQQVSVPVMSQNRCEKAYPNRIHESMICAGLDQGGIDSCQGDSGRPMVCELGGRYYLHGVTSWGYGCASPGKFGVYAQVKHVQTWLNQEMAKP